MKHSFQKYGDNFPGLQHELAHIPFSRQADLSQLIFDWSRLKDVIFVNNKPLNDILIEQGIDTQKIPDDKDPSIQKKFNAILSQLLPTNPNWNNSNLILQLPTILHQDGLLSNLEAQTIIKFTDQGLSLDNVKTGAKRRIYLNSTETGLSVKEIFAYRGDISKQDLNAPPFEQKKHTKPLLAWWCQYDIGISKNTLHPKLTDFDLVSPEKAIEAIAGKKITTETTKKFKEDYENIREDSTVDLSNLRSPFNN